MLHAVKQTTLTQEERPMAIVDFITELFCRVDDAMQDVPHHTQQVLAPSELVTILLYALKGVGNRAFYRWLHANYGACFRAYRNAHASSVAYAPSRGGPSAS